MAKGLNFMMAIGKRVPTTLRNLCAVKGASRMILLRDCEQKTLEAFHRLMRAQETLADIIVRRVTHSSSSGRDTFLKPQPEPCGEPQDVQALEDRPDSSGDDPKLADPLFEKLFQMGSEILVDLVDLSVLVQMDVE